METAQIILLTIIISPLLFGLTAFLGIFSSSATNESVKRMGIFSGIFSLIAGLIAITSAISVGMTETQLIRYKNIGFAVRIDALSATLLLMIAFLSFVIIKYSNNYLEGDDKQKLFLGRIASTIASVQLFVIAANLGQLVFSWILTSIFLHFLLIFYKNRKGAQILSKKKFIIARAGDLCIITASVILYNAFGTGHLQTIFENAHLVFQGVNSHQLELAAILVVIAAALKSAQFPTHGWLIEVVETPTPVSALLHAGLLNAGPFLAVRMAFLLTESHYAPFLLISIGGFTALFASIAYLTQPTIKVALGYSSVAHMGFMLMICGFGLHAAAVLHLVAHSFYKAHAFLSSGSVIDEVRANKVSVPKRLGNPTLVLLSLIIAFAIYSAIALAFGIGFNEEFPLLIAGAIIILGLAQIIAPAIDAKGSLKTILTSMGLATGVAVSFFSLETLFHSLLIKQLPELKEVGGALKILISAVFVCFSITVILQIIGSSLPKNDFMTKLRIHFKNGFYANAFFDRLIGSLKTNVKSINK